MNDIGALFRELKDSSNVSYMLSPDLRIMRTNRAWDHFARANRGELVLERWGRGALVLDAMHGELRAFYRDAFARALESGERWEHDFDCNTDQLFQRYRMIVYPVRRSILVVTSSLEVSIATGPGEATDATRYVHDGVIQMCANCRRVKVAGLDRWDLVPAYVRETPPMTSHGLCPPCARTYDSPQLG